MKRLYSPSLRVRAFITTIIACAAFSCTKDPALVSMVTFYVGDVKITSQGEPPRNASVRDIIRENDMVATGPNSEVTIQIGNDIMIKILSSTSIRIVSLLESESVKLKLASGKVLSKIGKLGIAKEFSVNTPTVTASIRATIFMVSHEVKTSTVAVGEGTVAVIQQPAAPVVEEPETKPEKQPEKQPEKEKTVYVRKNNAIIVTETPAPAPQKPAVLASVQRPITELETLYIKKIVVEKPIPRVAEKSIKEIETIREESKPETKVIDRKIDEFFPQSIQKISENYDRVDEVRLYSGKVYQGIIISRGEKFLIMSTPQGRVEIPVNQVKYTGIKK